VCCRVLQQVAVCYSGLHCVAVCCSHDLGSQYFRGLFFVCRALSQKRCDQVHFLMESTNRCHSWARLDAWSVRTLRSTLALQHPATPFNTLQHSATPCNTLQHPETPCNTLQHLATPCNTLQHPASPCNTLQHPVVPCSTLQHSATPCNTLQHPTTPCSTLQHPATPCTTLQHTQNATALRTLRGGVCEGRSEERVSCMETEDVVEWVCGGGVDGRERAKVHVTTGKYVREGRG